MTEMIKKMMTVMDCGETENVSLLYGVTIVWWYAMGLIIIYRQNFFVLSSRQKLLVWNKKFGLNLFVPLCEAFRIEESSSMAQRFIPTETNFKNNSKNLHRIKDSAWKLLYENTIQKHNKNTKKYLNVIIFISILIYTAHYIYSID